MRFGISYFNWTLLKKNLSRYWILWAGYALIWIYALPIRCLQIQQRPGADKRLERVIEFARDIPKDTLYLGMFLAVVVGLLAAAGVFSYLFNSRASGMLHALPIRREGLFFTSYVSGLVGLLVPHLLVWVLTLAAQAPSGYSNLYTITVWLLVQSALCIIFYSMAVFCVVFTGHILALPVFYGALNVAIMVISNLIEVLCQRFLYGFAGLGDVGNEFLIWMTPVARIIEDVEWRTMESGNTGKLFGVWTLVIYLAVAFILVVAALFIYRKRHVEVAGDVVAVPILRPVFRYGVAVCSGLGLGQGLYEWFTVGGDFGLAISILVWGAIGYFGAEMLLRKSFRVLDKWKGCVAVLAVMAVAVACVAFDWTGFVSRVPKQDNVQSVQLYAGHTVPYDSGVYLDEADITDPEAIQRILALHKSVVENREQLIPEDVEEYTYLDFRMEYTLSNGTRLRRKYNVSCAKEMSVAETATQLLCSGPLERAGYQLDEIEPDRITGYILDSLLDVKNDNYYSISGTAQEAQMIYEAVCADFAEGTLGNRYLFDSDPERRQNTYMADLHLQWEEDPVKNVMWDGTVNYYRRSYDEVITLTPQARHTLGVLKELGAIEDGALRLYGEGR